MHLLFKDFIAKWSILVMNDNISSYEWYVHLKILWTYVRRFKTEADFDNINLNILPFHIRWYLAEMFPIKMKLLLIDTRSFDYQGATQTFKIHTNDNLYVRKILVPYILRMHNSCVTDNIKPYIRSVFNYPIS